MICGIITAVMKMKKYIFSTEQISEIESARQHNKDKQIERRLRVLALRAAGNTLQEVSEKTGFRRSHVSSLIKQYFEKGITAISQKHYGGNHRNMSVEEEAELLEAYRQQADEGHILNVRELAAAYEAKVGHPVGNSQIYRVLHRHNWRKVMPRSKHPNKASAEVIETSKKLKLGSKS